MPPTCRTVAGAGRWTHLGVSFSVSATSSSANSSSLQQRFKEKGDGRSLRRLAEFPIYKWATLTPWDSAEQDSQTGSASSFSPPNNNAQEQPCPSEVDPRPGVTALSGPYTSLSARRGHLLPCSVCFLTRLLQNVIVPMLNPCPARAVPAKTGIS